ncbi:arylsulfatase regulator, partial [Sphingomonas melonis]
MLETMKRLDAHANALLLIGASDIDLLGGMF